MPILWVFETDVFVVQKGLFAIKNVENRLFTIYFHDFFSRSMTWQNKRLQGVHGVTESYKGLQGDSGDYKGLQGVTWGDKALQGVTKDHRNVFSNYNVPRYFPLSILHKNQS